MGHIRVLFSNRDQERHFVHLYQINSHFFIQPKIFLSFLPKRNLLSTLVELFPVSQHQNGPCVEWGKGKVKLVSHLQSGVSTP